jgi:hypothetical protein
MPSYAKALLEHWGVAVQSIPTSDAQQKQESDFLADFSGVRVLIEEKTKEDDLAYLSQRAQELESGQIHAASLPIRRDETLSGLVRDASHQLRSSSDKQHDFRLMWFTATGPLAIGKYEQFMATLYWAHQYPRDERLRLQTLLLLSPCGFFPSRRGDRRRCCCPH